MIVDDLQPAALARQLSGPGLRLRTGPLVTEVRSRLPALAEGIALYYADYPAGEPEAFADFHVRLALPHGPRRWLRPQVFFYFDGAPPFLPLPAAQAFPVLEWGLNWCVSSHCHQYLIVHAAVVERAGRALILPAPPGSGKSTLCAGLVGRGWRLLSDELALIEPDSGKLVPLPRPVSLKNASIDVIRRFSPRAVIGPTVRDTVKGSVAHMKAPLESVQRAMEPAQARWTIMPRYEAGAAARLDSLSRGRAFMLLAESSFNYSLHGRRGFETLASVIQNCDCYEFKYGDLDAAVALFDRLASQT